MIVLVCPDLWLKALKYVYYPLNLYNTSIHSIPFEKLIEQQVKTHAKLRIHKLLWLFFIEFMFLLFLKIVLSYP